MAGQIQPGTMRAVTFSAVMPSYLGEYPGAAKDRHKKIVRAVNSVLDQTYTDWELQVVADGCERTMEIMDHYQDPRIVVTLIDKRPLWCPGVRNRGIANSNGRMIVYLDTDDYWHKDHLLDISEALEDHPLTHGWGYFNAHFYNPQFKGFAERQVDIKRCATYGTANIVHENRQGLLWPDPPKDRQGNFDYGNQDCAFVGELKKLGPGTQLPAAGYMVCHEPNLLRIDV